MKKTNKKGFTLVEMMLVIAIIVILASVAAIGIGDALERYRAKQEMYKNEYVPAVNQAQLNVRDRMTTTRPERVPPTVSIRPTNTPRPSPTPSPTPDPSLPTPTPIPSPTPRPSNTPTPPTPTPDPGAGGGGGATGDVSSSSNMNSSGVWGNGGNCDVSVPSSCKGSTVTITVKFPGASISNIGGWNWTSGASYEISGDTITLVCPDVGDTTNFGIQINSGSGVSTSPQIVSVVAS